LPEYDYSQPGAYFVTIVTHERRSLFGAIVNNNMRRSKRGAIAEACWHRIPEHFSRVELGAFVVMPNHVHGILIFHDREAADSPPVGARHVVPLPGTRRFGMPQPGSLSTVIQQYKASVTRDARSRFGGRSPIWERNYYEHVIRDEADWDRLHRTIEANPMRWDEDEENPTPSYLPQMHVRIEHQNDTRGRAFGGDARSAGRGGGTGDADRKHDH
jgi:REP-associated tyrosine transposase